jgi:nitrate reductase NapE component
MAHTRTSFVLPFHDSHKAHIMFYPIISRASVCNAIGFLIWAHFAPASSMLLAEYKVTCLGTFPCLPIYFFMSVDSVTHIAEIKSFAFLTSSIHCFPRLWS